MEYYDILLASLEIFSAVMLFVIAVIAEKHISSKWRILYIIPAVLFVFLGAVNGADIRMLGTYAAAVIMLAGFVKDSARVRKISCIIAAVLCIASFPICMTSKGYRSVNYVKDFEKGFSEMKKHYVLTEHKNIDWDSLYEKYHPQFEQAYKNHDKTENYIAWKRFCAEFNDGHVSFSVSDIYTDEKMTEFEIEMINHLGIKDYGFSAMRLSDGSYAAVNVDESSKAAEIGIHNGTVITTINGMNLEEAAELSPLFSTITFTDKDNREFYTGLFASSLCDENISVSYIDDESSEITAELPCFQTGGGRFIDTKKSLDRGVDDIGHMQWKVIDENTVCLRLKMMMYNSEASKKEDYGKMKSELSEKINEYLDGGYRNLVIDMRSNGGGEGGVVQTLAELFAPEGEHYYCTNAKWSDEKGGYIYDKSSGKFEKDRENYFTGENAWRSNPIVILVNSSSVSAADHFTMIMQGMENITVIGFTEPNGSAQGIGTADLESGMLAFSGSLLLNKDGTVFIDSGIDMESGDDIDIRVPFDENAINAIFNEDKDYLLEKAIEYMNSK